MEGLMHKRSTGAFRRWQQRYFAVAGHHLKDASTAERLMGGESKGGIDLRAMTACTQKAQFVTLELPEGKVLELQAQDEAAAQEWRTAINEARAGAGEVTAEEVAKLQSLAHYAPRKGTLVLGRKGSRSSMAVAPPTALPPPSPSPGTEEPSKVVHARSGSTPAVDMSPEQVAEWLVSSIGNAYAKYGATFIDEGINGAELRDLGNDDLVDLGVGTALHRKRILKEVSKLYAA
jgi:hypothetical protein